MVPGDGGAEEGRVKVNLFRKNPIGSKGDGAGTFFFGKKSSQINIQISIIFTFKVRQ